MNNKANAVSNILNIFTSPALESMPFTKNTNVTIHIQKKVKIASSDRNHDIETVT